MASVDGTLTPIVGPETVRAAVRLNALQLLGTGELGLAVDQPDDRVYQVEISADLQAWSLLTLSTNRDGLLRFRDSDAFRLPQRFYRAVER